MKLLPCPNPECWDSSPYYDPDVSCIECETCNTCGPTAGGNPSETPKQEAGRLWNQLPRTKWVKLSERLPDSGFGLIPVIHADAEENDHRTWAYYSRQGDWRELARYGSFVLTGVTHWLDGIPPAPEIEGD